MTDGTRMFVLDPLQRAVLLAMTGLAASVMQNDEENGRAFIEALSQPGMEGVCKAVIELLNTEGDHAASH